MERQLLALIIYSHEAYESINEYLEESDFSPRGWVIYRKVKEIYETDPKITGIDREFLIQSLARSYPKFEDEFKFLIEKLPDDVATTSVHNELLQFKLNQSKTRLGQFCLGTDTRLIDEEIERYSAYRDGHLEVKKNQKEDTYIGYSIKDLASSFDSSNLFPIFPSTLNSRLDGGLNRGSHVMIYGYTEVGKSLFTMNWVVGLATKNYKVLYLENEDPIKNTLTRFLMCILGKTRKEVLSDPEKNDKDAMDRGYGNIIVKDVAGISMRHVRKYMEEFEPDVLVVNQLQNIKCRAEGGVEARQDLVDDMREITKSNDILGISVTQGSDSSRGKLILDAGDVYYSNVALQSQTDLMIGIGADDTYMRMNRRMISFPKNKVSGDHSPLPVQYDIQHMRVYNIQ